MLVAVFEILFVPVPAVLEGSTCVPLLPSVEAALSFVTFREPFVSTRVESENRVVLVLVSVGNVVASAGAEVEDDCKV